MKCVQFASTGRPSDVLQIVEREVGRPTRGEVRVRMLASPINPSDLMFIQGTYGREAELPQVPGFEGVGVVEESGGGLKGQLFKGKRVAVLNKAGGNWAEQVVVPVSQVIPLSASLSLDQAATFFVNPATAWIMTQEVLQVPAGAWLLQTAAASTLGRMIVRLGKTCGFRTLNIVRRREQVDELQQLGGTSTLVFDARTDDPDELHAQIMATTDSAGIKYAVDPVGGIAGSTVIRSLAAGGRMLAFGTLSEQPLHFSPRSLMTKGAAVEGFWLGNFMAQKNLIFKLRLVKRITRLIRSGVLASDISHRFPLEQISDAVEAASSGKVLLTMSSN